MTLNKKPVGRPPVADKGKTYSIRLNDAERAKMKLLGGVRWLKGLLK